MLEGEESEIPFEGFVRSPRLRRDEGDERILLLG